MSPRAKDPLAAMRKRFVALGYDDAEMVEQMKDPAFRAAFNAPRKLHGSAPPADAVRLYTLAEMPPWAKPARPHASNVSYFFGREGVRCATCNGCGEDVTKRGPEIELRQNCKACDGTCREREISQAVFAVDAAGAVFLDLVRLTPKGTKPLFAGDVTPLPGCVLIAVGVEQIRRARAGR